MAAPLIEAADCTESGSNTASASWAVSFPDASTGDLLLVHLAWDDSTTTTGITTAPTGPNGETITWIGSVFTDSGTTVRGHVGYYVATGSWTSGTRTFTPSASEQWTAVVVRVPAGEFNATTPIGATNTTSLDSTSTTMPSPTLSAGAGDGVGRVVFFATIDTVTTSAWPSGWTNRITRDRGAVGCDLSTRDAATTISESIASANFTLSAADTAASRVYIVRGVLDALDIATPGSLTISGQSVNAEVSDLGGNAWATGAWAMGAWATGAWDVAATGDLSTSISTAGALTIDGQALTKEINVALSHGSLTVDGQAVDAAISANLTLGIDPGSLTIDGQTVTADLTLDLFATIENGSLTIDGQTVSVDLGSNLSVDIDAGALAIDGQGITASINTALSSGALSIAGQATKFAWSVPWAEGSLTINGQSLAAATNIALNAGTLTIDGQTVNAVLGNDLSVDIDAGALTLSGQAQAATVNIALAEGSLTIAGQSVSASVSLEIDAGALAISGQPITSDVGIALAAGALTIDGQTVEAALGNDLSTTIDAGSLSISGQTLTTDLTNDLFVSIDNGSLTLDGQSAGVDTGVALSHGALTLAGQAVDSGLGLPVEAGSLTLSGENLTTQIGGSFEVEIEAGSLTLSGQEISVSGIEAPRDPMLGGGPSRDDRKKFKKWLERKPYQPIDVEIDAGTLSISGQQVDVNLTGYREPFTISEAIKRPLLRLPQRKAVPPDIDTQIATEIRYAETLEVQKRKKRRKQDEEILLLM